MYGWLWRKLPYGPLGRTIGCVVAVLGIVGILWFGVFPAVDPHLPFNHGAVTTDNGSTPTQAPQDVVTPSPSTSGGPTLPN
jgi:hypothetical protein